MLANDLRQRFLTFFAQKHGHKIIPGSSLIPENDPTVLFTTAGMHPLVPYLMGEKHPEGSRLVDVQKCVRTGDIDEVGDPTHLTFYTPASLKKILFKYNFKNAQTQFSIDWRKSLNWEFPNKIASLPLFIKKLIVYLLFSSALSIIRNSFWMLAQKDG